MNSFEIPSKLSVMTLLRLYWYDKIYKEGEPEFEELSAERLQYLAVTECFYNFCNSKRAKELEIEMYEMLN